MEPRRPPDTAYYDGWAVPLRQMTYNAVRSLIPNWLQYNVSVQRQTKGCHLMLTDLQKRKFKRYFDFYDIDNNGYIEREDYTRFAQRLAEARGWAEGTARFEMVMGRYMAEWDVLRSFADMDANDRISLEEWYAYQSHNIYIDSKFRSGENDIIATIFETLDSNGDGQITVDEFITFYRIHNAPSALAREIFARIDENGDGIITRSEIAKLYRQFAHSDDPEALGNWLFGPF